MKYNPEIHHRNSIRLKDYDYSQEGLYFITICTKNREKLFGEIVDRKMNLNHFGAIVLEEILKSEQIRKEIKIHNFVIMPNHLHIVVEILNVGAKGISPKENFSMKPKSISSFVAGLKTAITTRINKIRLSEGCPLWQRNYYENIIRNEETYNKVMQYIEDNPMKWDLDKYYEN